MLVPAVAATAVDARSVALWWLGQSGFALKGHRVTVYLDPYLSTRLERLTASSPIARHVRLCPIPVNPEEIKDANYVFCSHDHGDHLDPETVCPIGAASPQAKFVVPRAAFSKIVGLGISPERVIAADAGERREFDGIWFAGIPGKHNDFDRTPEGYYPYLGFVIGLGDVTVYHAGDTVFYDDLAGRLREYSIDLALLPINSGDPDRVARGFKSNLNYKEAADLGVAIGARIIIPMHYGMFAVNDERVERFLDYLTSVYPNQGYHVMTLGERFVYTKDS